MKILKKFYDAQAPGSEQGGAYGYASDETKVSPFNFGLNAGKTFLTKFEWINNGGAGGAEQEALEIIFNINGTDKSYRMFPVTQAFGKNQEKITDPNAPEFKDAITTFNARVTHILHCFMDSDTIKASFSRPIKSFKEFCQIAMSILPKNYKDRVMDIFLQWQWQISKDNNRTYLDIPGSMKYGKWLCPTVAPINSTEWTEKRADNPTDNTREALWYEDGAGNHHPFVKNGWFMNSNFAKQQRSEAEAGTDGGAAAASETAATINAEGEKKASAW